MEVCVLSQPGLKKLMSMATRVQDTSLNQHSAELDFVTCNILSQLYRTSE